MNRLTTTPFERQRWALSRWQLWPVLVLLMTLGQSALAQTYTAIDCPFSFSTLARGINDRGDIVGFCEDVNGLHGFLLRNGVLKLIDVPGAAATRALGINNRGDVAGAYADSNDVLHGFVLRKGRFHTIDPPGSIGTTARGIDDLGRIVGFYRASDEVFRGFILDWRGFRDIVFPGAEGTAAYDINILAIVGGYIMDGVPHGFHVRKGVFTSIDAPGAAGTEANGINLRGQIVGGWTDDAGCADCFTRAFLLTRHGFEFLEFTDVDGTVAAETVAFGINVKGQIVGQYFSEEDETFHGFLFEPRR
jgi:uncharacterized membrane protein